MKIKLAGAREHTPSWREQIDLLEVDALTDEFGWDEWLEAVGDGEGAISVQRVSTPIPSFHRYNEHPIKVAAATNWDSEFVAAQSHAKDVLAKLNL